VKQVKDDLVWANLLHFGMNMWGDRDSGRRGCTWYKGENFIQAKPYVRFDVKLWRDLLKRMAEAGMNMAVIDIGEILRYESHPEIAVKGSWRPARLKKELDRARKLGVEPIQKLNFSTTHDAWLGVYSRQVSSPIYYAVCADLIAEVVDLFDQPRLFHLGYDEETAAHQAGFAYAVMRQHELWWRDFYFFVEQVEKRNVRPWIWSDYVWHHPDEFFRKMPKSVLQSNWFYQATLKRNRMTKFSRSRVNAYLDLDAHGYDQVPTSSNHANNASFQATVDFCRERIHPKRLKGFLQTPWRATVERYRKHHERAIRQVGTAIRGWT